MRSDVEYRDTQYSRMLLALGGFIVIGVGIAVGAIYGLGVQNALWVAGGIGLIELLRRSRLQVRVAADGIQVGTAHLPWAYVSHIEVLEGGAMRAAMTTDAHPRDFMQLRDTKAGVRVWLNDATDPHRAWLASVRDPGALATVLAELERLGSRNGR